MFGFVRGVRGRAVAVVFVVTGLLGGVTASSVAAATKTTVTWNVSALTAGQVRSLSAIATTNSTGVKTWSKTGSCVLSPISNPTKLTMGTGASCTLRLNIARSGDYPAKTSTKTIQRKPYRVGQAGPGGGIIFYVDLTRAVGSQYFEAACAGWSDGICGGSDLTDPTPAWGCSGRPISGAVGIAIGTGEQNTDKILAGCADAGIAARRAKNLVLGGQSDWFLPSKNELNALCKWAYGDTVNAVCNNGGYGGLSLTSVGGISTDFYWSSSEDVDDGAWFQNFGHGDQAYDFFEDGELYVRPVRAF